MLTPWKIRFNSTCLLQVAAAAKYLIFLHLVTLLAQCGGRALEGLVVSSLPQTGGLGSLLLLLDHQWREGERL